MAPLNPNRHPLANGSGSDAAVDYALPEFGQLINAFAPIVYFHGSELPGPALAEKYFQKARLVSRSGETRTLASVNSMADASGSGEFYLELKEGVPGGRDKSVVKSYVHVKPAGAGHLDLQYWFFYTGTGLASAHVKWLIDDSIKGYDGDVDLAPLGVYGGNWEYITVRINKTTQKVEQVFFPKADNGFWMKAEELQMRNNQVVVYASKGSFAFYPFAGTYQVAKVRLSLYSSQLEFCLQHEACEGRKMSFAGCCELVAVSAGAGQFPEPPWLHLGYSWGNPNPDYLTTATVKRTLQATFGKTLDFLLNKDILDTLVPYLLEYFSRECRQKSMAPKQRACWSA